MKKVLKKFNRTLSIMLAAAMVLTMVPQTAMPVLAANDDAVIQSQAEPADVEETSAEQETEGTEPSEEISDEGNSGTEGDDITSGDPVEEDPVEEEPSEGDVEEAEEPTIDLMVDEDPPAAADTFNVTLPTNPQGYTISDAAATATKNTDYTFKVTAQTGYRITAVKYTIGTETSDANEVEDAENTYKIPGAKITADITITVGTVQTVKVTVNANADTRANLAYLCYGNDTPSQDLPSDGVLTVDKEETVKLLVTPKDETIDVAVKKGSAPVSGTKNIYDLGAITANVTVTVTATKNRYKITESINKIKVTEGEGENATEVEKTSAVIDYAPSGNNYKTESNEDDETIKMIVAKQDLKFKVDPAAGVDFTGKKVIVSYKIGADGKEEILTAATTGVYTVPKAKITGDITLKVVVRNPEKYTVTLKKNDNITALYALGTSNDFVNKFEAVEESDDTAADVAEDSVFKFQLTAKDYYKITKVMVDETVLTAKSGVYSFNVTGNATIEVTTDLDKTQFKTLTYKLTGDAGSATAVLSGIATENDFEKLNNTSLVAGKTVDIAAKTGDEVTLTITPKDGYTIDKIDGKAPAAENVAANGVVTHKVTFAAAKAATVTVTTKVKAAGEALSISFDKAGVSNVDYTVTGDKKVTKNAGNANTYDVAAGAEKLLFTITAKNSYEPTVTQTSKPAEEGDGGDGQESREGTSKTITASKTTIKGTDATYEYVIPATLLADGDTFTITENQIKKTVKIEGDAANADVVVSRNGRAEGNATSYEVKRGETVAVNVTQKDGCTLASVDYTVGSEKKTVAAKNGAAAFSVVVADDTTVTVNAAADYKAVQLKKVTVDEESNETLSPIDADAKGVYPVSYDGTYKVGLTQGTSTDPVTIDAIKVFDGSKDITTDNGVTVTNASGNIKLTDAVAGKKLTAKLFVTAGTESVDTGVVYTLQVSKPVSTINVADVKNQPTDTTKKYKITTNTGADLGKLVATTAADNKKYIEKVEAVGNELVITTGQEPTPAEGVKVTVSAGDEVKKEITVTSTALLTATQTPTVTQKGATDIDLTLTLGAKKIDDAAIGTVLYEVTVTPKKLDGEKKTENRIDAALTKYFVKDGDSQDVTINVTNATEEKTVALGDGDEWSFDVAVKLVHAKATYTGKDAITVPENGLIAGETSNTSKTLVAKTKTPAWESNLKLKKGTTTLYTGQSNVVIATPQFSKTTTYTDIDESDIEDIASPAGGDKLTGFKVNSDGTISVSATKTTAVGKHTIQVIARARKDSGDYTMYASRATIVVTVERGINKLAVDVPSYSLYKANGKAATLKPTVIFNDDTTGKDKTKQPKAKNVTWALVKNDGTTPWTDPKVSINAKNGTVTVAKDYILKANDADNKFKIKVSVDNGTEAKPKWIGAADPAVTSDSILITNEGAQIAAVAVVATVSGKVKVIAEPTKNDSGKIVPTAVSAVQLQNSTVVAFTATDYEKEYDDWNALKAVTVPDSNLAFKSSKAKNVEVGRWGALKVNSPASGVKLTVTANDGSKSKGELTLNVDYDATRSDKLALGIYKTSINKKDGSINEDIDWSSVVYDPNGNGNDPTQSDITVDPYNGTAVSRLALVVYNYDPNSISDENTWIGYRPASKHANFTVKAKSGAKITGEGEGWDPDTGTNYKVYYATIDKGNAVVELSYTDKDVKKTHLYNLTNSDFVTSGAKVKAKVVGNLHQYGKSGEQDVKLELEIPAEFAASLSDTEGTKTSAAKIDVDWSKLNAKNEADLRYFADSLAKDVYDIELVDLNAATKKATIQLAFKNNDEQKFLQNSYALKVSVGSNVTADGKTTFTPAAPAVAATVKVTKTAKFTFKPTASYTIGAKDGYAVLGGKSSIPEGELNLAFTGLLNLADKNGIENHFTDTFEVENGKLKVKAGTQAAEYLQDKANLTGYLKYTAKTDKTYYDTMDQSGLVKITVKVNANAVVKYTHNAVELVNKSGETAQVQVQVNTKDAIQGNDKNVKIAYAKFEKTDNPFTVAVNEDGTLTLTMTDTTTKLKLGAKLWIVPADSSNRSNFEDGDGKAKDVELSVYKQYGTSMTLNVTFKAPAQMTLAEAKTAVENWVNDVPTTTPTPAWLTVAYDNDAAAKAAVLAEVKNSVNATDNVTIEVANDGFTYTAAVAGTDGVLSGSFTVTVGSGSETVAFNFTIPKPE